jgi:murein DD-endopeptidase MepM/ murein hydrolase activator NlpD
MLRATARRVALVLVAALALGAFTPIGPARADSGGDDVQRAAQAVADARDRANRAADAYTDAENKLDDLTEQQAQLQKDIDATTAKVDALASGVTTLAVDRVVNGDGGSTLFSGLKGPTEEVEQEVISRLALNASTTSIDEYDAARHELDLKQAQLDRTKKETEQAAAFLKSSQEKALKEIEVLKQLEQKALKDRAVAQAVAAQKAEEKRQIEQQAAAAAAAAAKARATSGSGNAGAAANPGASGGGAAAPPSGGAGASKSIGGCRADCGYVDTAIICPVAGPAAFGDTWGAARSGGRHHQGVDMLAPRGTPIVAVVSGVVDYSHNRLGGNAAWVSGASGRYYYAHMDHYQGSNRAVQQGEVIGYVGDTGNARGTPHLHFEVHPGGGAAVNPYPSVRAAC